MQELDSEAHDCDRKNNTQTSGIDTAENGINRCPIMSNMRDLVQQENNDHVKHVPSSKITDSHSIKQMSTETPSCFPCERPNQMVSNVPNKSAVGKELIQESSHRKTSNISVISMASSSAASDEHDDGRKLELKGLIECIGTLLIPVVSMM